MSEQITERPNETRITTEPPPPAEPPRKPLGVVRALTVLGWVVVVWAVLTSLGALPHWERDRPTNPDLVRPVDLPEVFAAAEEFGKAARPWPDEGQPPLFAAVEQLLANVRHATGKGGIGLGVRREGGLKTGTHLALAHENHAV